MYIYRGVLNYPPFASNTTFHLVVEDGGFRLGAGIRAFWKWTSNAGSDGAVNKLACGTVDRVDLQEKPSMTSTFGIFYDQYYPFDIVAGGDLKNLHLIMYEFPKSNSGCHVVAELDVRCVYSARTVVPEYNASRNLPTIRYYALGYWGSYLFGMIVPDIIATGRPIWVAAEDDKYWYDLGATMTLVSEDTEKFTVSFTVYGYYAKMKLWKNSDYWECVEWRVKQATDTARASNITAMVDMVALSHGSPLSPVAKSVDGQKLLPSRDADMLSVRPIPATNIAVSNTGAANHIQHLRAASTQAASSGAAADDASNEDTPWFGKTTTIVNNTSITIFCTLEDSGNTTKGKVLAGIGAGLAVMGMMPLGEFAMPVAAIGVLLSSVGVLDAFNDAAADLKMLLFPNETMTGNNDVLFMYVEIESDTLYLRVGYEEKVGEGRFLLSELKNKGGVVTTIFQIGWTDFSDKYIQACKLLRLPQLVPLYDKAADVAALSKEVSYADVSDGQMILDAEGNEALFNTLNSSPSYNTEMFTWQKGEVSTVLLHAYRPGVTRWHDVIRLPKSRVIVLRLQRCWIDVDNDKKRSSMTTPRTSESDVLQLMGARFSGYDAYSWSFNNSPFAFTKESLVGAKVKYNNDDNSFVYIVYSSLLPWQRVAKKE
ncbi:hypothetical protein B0I35DRAFT_500874 [Stachybotrys elegans]|uniref:Uncharacterized protein n=1 Tax=Stachybotrys elegans TaxID=80388 RepID=A0A8K0WTL2_9HYPO|nr:hypothetical protein B0I35DRAFT_500874 [Stachybotrys elegans]